MCVWRRAGSLAWQPGSRAKTIAAVAAYGRQAPTPLGQVFQSATSHPTLPPPPTCVCTTLEDPQHSQITLHPQKPGTVTIKKNIKTLLNRRCRSSASLYPYFQCSVGPSKLLLAILPCLFLLFNYLPVVIIYGFFSSHRKVTLKAKLLSSSKSHRHNINYFQRSIKIEDITRH